jgi:type IV secretion system protein VirB4
MVRLSRLLKDYGETGAINSLIALWGFVDETTFLTKSGHVGVVYRVHGIDAEGLTHAQRLTAIRQFEGALRSLDEHWRVYQYVLKQPTDAFVAPMASRRVAAEALAQRTAYLNARRDDLFDIEHVFVLLYESPLTPRTSTGLRGLWRRPAQAMQQWLSLTHTTRLLESDLDRAVSTLQQRAAGLEVQLAELAARGGSH